MGTTNRIPYAQYLMYESLSRIQEGIKDLNVMFYRRPKVKRVIFNDPATIILWEDGSKTVVKCQSGDTYNRETGFALAYLKKMLGNDNTFNKEINKWVRPEEASDESDDET